MQAMTRVLLVVGGQRCGSTSLVDFIRRVGGMPILGVPSPERRLFLTHRDPIKYLSRFARQVGESDWVGEKATSYLEHPELPHKLQRYGDQLSVVAILRDPAKRAVSNYRMSRRNGFETRPPEIALTRAAENRSWDRRAVSVSPFHYLRRGEYAQLLKPWLEAFPTMEIIILETFARSRLLQRRFFDRIGLPMTSQDEPFGRSNRDIGYGSAVGDGEYRRLQQYYHEANVKLEEMLGVNLNWGSKNDRP